MNHIRSEIYAEEKSEIWDQFVEKSENGTLHSKKRFLGYHQEKFQDCSQLFYSKNDLIAILPAAIYNSQLVSHPGAAYGGLIYDKNLKIEYILEINKLINQICLENNISQIVYRLPYSIISKYHFDKFLYSISKKTLKIEKELSQFIDLSNYNKGSYSKNFNRIIKNSNFKTMVAKSEKEISDFYDILMKNLKRHNAQPTHTLNDLSYLLHNLDQECQLFITKDSNANIVSGSFVMILNRETVHSFYLCTDYEFIKSSPLVSTIDFIGNYYSESGYKYLNLGISTENKGEKINLPLQTFKEKFNSVGTIRETYTVEVKN
tara:strand:+ start:3091 stop:4047 length:957 start_codon:yes stop_codon:yes gene_type:complete